MGVKVSSSKIGNDAEDIAVHINGQELPAHDGRFSKNVGIMYGIDATPGKHTQWSLGEFR